MNTDSKIYVAGNDGMVGTTLIKLLRKNKFNNIIYKSIKELDLRDEVATNLFFTVQKPDCVFLLAARVGGIQANINYPADFIYDNLKIQTNVIHMSYKQNVKKLLFIGSSCIYPRNSIQPMKEEYLLDGKLEPTNESYAIAKIAGIKMCQYYNKQHNTNFISAMPSNVYGYNDNFDLKDSHVLAALIRRFYEAKINKQKEIEIWGTGKARREFLFADDLADALLFLMQKYNDSEIINIGVGKDISIKELAELVKEIIGFKGKIVFDTTKPDGMPRKLLDVSKINNLGWQAKISLKEGIEKTYNWYLENK